jgi:serine/threonine protein kinase
MMHKPTLARERALFYDEAGKLEMITNLDKVYNEIEIWGRINDIHFIKFYELIDTDEHDYMYLILELADLGQLAHWDYKVEKYLRNQKIYDFVLALLGENEAIQEGVPEAEQVARFLFRQLAIALVHLHDELGIIHRDIKLDNILFSSKDMCVKLTDFTVSRGDIKESTRLFDSQGTPAFTAPECHIVEEGGYLPKPTDIWSFGVSLYAYVEQIVPFYASGGELEM